MHQQSSTLKFFCVGLFVCTAFSSFAGWVLNEDKTQLSDGYWTLAVVADGENLKITSLTAGTGDLDLSDVSEDTGGYKITAIGPSAFNKKTGLTSICAPDVVVIEDGASSTSSPFYACSSLTNAVFPSVTTIGNLAFRSCTKLSSVSFDSVTRIGDEAFRGVRGITNFLANADITYIGDFAFYIDGSSYSGFIKRFEPTTLPKLEYIGDKAFQGDRGGILQGDFYLPALTNLGNQAMASSSITSFRAPSLKYLRDKAFNNCPNITNVEVSADITYIGVQAFARTSSFQTCVVKTFKPTTLPALHTIGEKAFFGSSGSNLEGDFYCPALTNLGSMALSNSRITSFRAPLLTRLLDKAFNACPNITNVEVSADITYIGANAFSRTSTGQWGPLETFTPTTLPKLEIIGGQAFYSSKGSLKGDFYCPALTNLGSGAFQNTKITSFDAPRLATVSRNAFMSCANLSNVVVRGGGTIEQSCFASVNIDSLIIRVLGPAPTSIGSTPFIAISSGYDYPQVRVARSKYLDDWLNLSGMTFTPFETAKEHKTYKSYLGNTPEDRTIGLFTGKGAFWLVDDDTTKHTIFTLR